MKREAGLLQTRYLTFALHQTLKWMSAAALLSTVAAPSAQAQTPLPSELTVWAWPHTNADVLYPPTSGPEEFIKAEFTFLNAEENKVEIEWRFRTANATGKKRTKHDVAFKPTSVAAFAGRSNTLYVVGWSERASKVIVAEWVLGNMALVETITPNGKYKVTLTEPTITQTIIAGTDQLSPISCAVVNPWANEIYLLDASTPRTIHRMDIASGSVLAPPLLTESAQPALATQRSLVSGVTPSGFIVFSQPARRWIRPSEISLPQTIVSLTDSNLDGVIDDVESLSVETFNAFHLNQWDLQYTGP